MASCKELALNWNNALSTWLPSVIVDIALGFLRVDHVVRILPCDELWQPNLDNVRNWLFFNIAPFDLFYLCMDKIAKSRGIDWSNLTLLGKNIFDKYMPAMRAGCFSEELCLRALPVTLMSTHDESRDNEIWKFLRTMLVGVETHAPNMGLSPDAPQLLMKLAGVKEFLTGLSSSDRALAFDSETGACFSFDRGSQRNIDHLFGRGTDVLAATEQAWQTRRDFFHLRDNLLVIVDVVDEDGQTRVAFEKTP